MPLSIPEVCRWARWVTLPPERQRFAQQWAAWRQQHQAVAKACHQVHRRQRLQLQLPLPSCLPAALFLPGLVPLTEQRWQQIRAGLPPEKPKTGRPGKDHRQILEGILWVMRTGNAWRSLPASYGRWQTLYTRYHGWCADGQWARIRHFLLAPSS